MEQQITRVAVGILRNKNTILLCQRRKGGRYEWKLEFPGGKIEAGESIEQGLKRELQEELSITVSSVRLLETYTSYYEDGGWFEVTYCEVQQFTGTMTNNVFEQFRWVPLVELSTYDILEGNKPFIQKLLAHEIV